MSEAEYQRKLIKKIKKELPGCYILKNDPTHLQGVPDLLVIFGTRWAMLEVKVSQGAKTQSNQQHYIDVFSKMGYASFIFPECEATVLKSLKTWFEGE